MVRRMREQLAEDRELELERIKRDYQETLNEMTKKQRKL